MAGIHVQLNRRDLQAFRDALDPAQVQRAINRGLGRASVILRRKFAKELKAATPVSTGRLRRRTRVLRRRVERGVYELVPAAPGAPYMFALDARTGYLRSEVARFRADAETREIIIREVWKSLNEQLEKT